MDWRLQRARLTACISVAPPVDCRQTSICVSGRSRSLSAKRSSQRASPPCRGLTVALAAAQIRARTTSPRLSGGDKSELRRAGLVESCGAASLD